MITELTEALELVKEFIRTIVSKVQSSMVSMDNYRRIRSISSVLRPKLLRVLRHLHRLFHTCKSYRCLLEQFRLLRSSSSKFSQLQASSFSFSSFLFASFLSFCAGKCGNRRYEASSSRGAILIMVACFLPIILLGIKYSEKLFQQKEQNITRSEDTKIVKICAQEAALEVARNWNPGLKLSQQQEGVYKVADAVYNAHPSHYNSVLGRALPGVMAYDDKGKLITSDASCKQVGYTDEACYNNIYCVNDYNGSVHLWNPHFALWRAVDGASDSSNRISVFDEMSEEELAESNFVLIHHDIYQSPVPCLNYTASLSDLSYSSGNDARVYYQIPSFNTAADSQGNYALYNFVSHIGKSRNTEVKESYKKRSTGGDKDYVSISLKDDKIKVKTDEQEGYAIPAQCNVDIVLAVPVNGAASNADNLDASSETEGEPYYSTAKTYVPTEAALTPLYQMGQALKTFVKTHFYHTRGVNMSLIPYSGKLSISPDRATSWTVAFPSFVDTSTNTQLMIGACLYGTSGVKDAALKQTAKTTAQVSGDALPTSDTPYYWGGVLTGCPIMFRAGLQQRRRNTEGIRIFEDFWRTTVLQERN